MAGAQFHNYESLQTFQENQKKVHSFFSEYETQISKQNGVMGA